MFFLFLSTNLNFCFFFVSQYRMGSETSNLAFVRNYMETHSPNRDFLVFPEVMQSQNEIPKDYPIELCDLSTLYEMDYKKEAFQ